MTNRSKTKQWGLYSAADMATHTIKGIYKFGRTSGAVGGVEEATGAGEKDRRAIKDLG